jgi:hypothetical protein
MSTTVSFPARRKISRRAGILAVLSALVAAASITLTIALGLGGGDVSSSPVSAPATATPDRATLYQRGAGMRQPSSSVDATTAADRFHHFR